MDCRFIFITAVVCWFLSGLRLSPPWPSQKLRCLTGHLNLCKREASAHAPHQQTNTSNAQTQESPAGQSRPVSTQQWNLGDQALTCDIASASLKWEWAPPPHNGKGRGLHRQAGIREPIIHLSGYKTRNFCLSERITNVVKSWITNPKHNWHSIWNTKHHLRIYKMWKQYAPQRRLMSIYHNTQYGTRPISIHMRREGITSWLKHLLATTQSVA